MIEIAGYKCEDGQIFENYEEAQKHEKRLDNKECLQAIVEDINDYFYDALSDIYKIDIDDVERILGIIYDKAMEYNKKLEDFI